MRNLTLIEILSICLIGCTIFGAILGFSMGMVLQKEYIEYQIDESAQPYTVLHTELGYYTVIKYNTSCYTIECVQRIINNSNVGD